MPTSSILRILAVAGCLSALAACRDAPLPESTPVSGTGGGTAVLGANNAPAPSASAPVLLDAQGRALPEPPLPPGTRAQEVRLAADAALAVWIQDGTVMASRYTTGGGWTSAQALEDIHGDARDVQLASNGQGLAMAVWQHSVGSIQSLRFSRFETGVGWSVPDVVPGALPRPTPPAPPELHMDAGGNAYARWPSGFAEGDIQTSRFAAGQGWSRASGEPGARH